MSHGGTLSPMSYDLAMSLLASAALLLLLLLFIICKKKPMEPEDSLDPITIPAKHHPLADIHAATHGFAHRQIIGTGPLGAVYHGALPDHGLVAIKRLHPQLVLGNAGASFAAAIRPLSHVRHPNIVPLVGFSEAPGERIVVSELMGMKSLEYHLHQYDHSAAAFLTWPRRLRMAAEAAAGVAYLHEGITPNVVHGCIKPSNILIDQNFHARVCDFGLSCLAPQEKRGLIGYVDREFWTDKSCCVTRSSDVYGFGVVLLELLTGRRSDGGLMVEWALPLIRKSRVVELLDPRPAGVPLDMDPLLRWAKVALACVGNDRKDRPSMGQVAAILSNLSCEFDG